MKRLLILCGALALAAGTPGCAGKGSSGRPPDTPTRVDPLTQPGTPGGKALPPPPPPPPIPGRT